MALSALFILLGLLLLTAGAEALVRGGSRLAFGLGLSPLFIGLTVVAYGTSSPELMVSVLAALEQRPDIAIGNVVGSNIFNIAVVLGIAALIAPLPCKARVVRREVPIVIALTLALLAFALDGRLNQLEAALLLVGLGAYTSWGYRMARAASAAAAQADPADPAGQVDPAAPGAPPEHPKPPKTERRSALPSIALAIVGVAGLFLGARWLVHGAVDIARTLGISDAAIGLSLVATGTSLPELATSIVASFRRELDIAIGNVLGSNIFNVLGILGITASLYPISVPRHMVRFDIPIALGFAVACLPIMLSARRISRGEGLLLLSGYAAYMVFLFTNFGWNG